MKKYFEEQLKTATTITKEKINQLKGRSFYSNYKEGDVFLAFLEQEIDDVVEKPYTEPSIILSLNTVVERELNDLKKDFKFIRMSEDFPVLERKKNNEKSSPYQKRAL